MYRRTLVSTSKVRLLANLKHSYRGLARSTRKEYEGSSKTSQNINNKRRIALLSAAIVGVGGYTFNKHWALSVELREATTCEEVAGDREKEFGKGDRKRHWKHWKARHVGNEPNLNNAIKESRDLAQAIKDEVGSPGLVVSVSVDGREIWSEGLGYADIENRVPCTGDTVMRIASISKPITMAVVAKLWEAGKLDLDKCVTEYVESWPMKEFNKEKVTITTRQLVSHLGGIRHYNKSCKKKDQSDKEKKKDEKSEEDKGGSTKSKDGSSKDESSKGDKKSDKADKKKKNKSEFELAEYHIRRQYDSVKDSLKMFQDDALCSKPGTEFYYTTHGWTLVAAVTEGATGQTFTTLLKGLLKDLGLEKTYLDENDPLIYNRARYYVKNDRGRIKNAPYVNLSYKWAGGGMLSNVKDLNKFGNAMLYSYQYKDSHTRPHEGEGGLPGYLQPETVNAMWTPVDKTECSWDSDGSYGMGWAVIPGVVKHGACRDQRFYVSHTGGAIGASSVLLVLPRKPRTLTEEKGTTPPRGVVVSMIVNLQSVGLNKTALEIAKKFEQLEL